MWARARAGSSPAAPGSTRAWASRRRCGGDHPRMRREHLTDIAAGAYATESSPHARGTPRGRREVENKIGIISACAGSTTTTSSRPRPRRDHPRMRGEHAESKPARSSRSGSPPHARGTQGQGRRLRDRGGITPPRMRGEHMPLTLSPVPSPGSPPHARGTLHVVGAVREAEGITPACAGNTRIPLRNGAQAWDHPRIRGEHSPRSR